MMRYLVPAALAALLCPCVCSSAAGAGGIISEITANRHGLARPWITQVQMDRGRGRVTDLVLSGGTLIVQTDRAMVHAIDAENGNTLWAKQIGRPDHPSMTPGVGNDLVAVVNGSRLYVCNRYNGDLLFETQVTGAPGGGAAVSQQRTYVPMVDGMVLSYRLKSLTDPTLELGITSEIARRKEKPEEVEADRRENLRLQQEYIPPLACQSLGRAMVQPLVTLQNEGEEYVAWPTDRGFLNIARVDRREERKLDIRYRLETAEGIAARPTYLPRFPNVHDEWGMIFIASRDGFVHAIQENNGDSFWRFSTGEPISQPAVAIDQNVFVATQFGGMFCLDATTGQQKWWTPQIAQFIAASKDRVYVVDKIGRLLALNIKTGARLDTILMSGPPIKMINSQTDRLYLATESGLIHCLHELEHKKPIMHGEDRLKAAEKQLGPEAAGAQGGVQPGGPVVQPPPAGQPAVQPPPAGPGPKPLPGDPGGADEDPLDDADADPFS